MKSDRLASFIAEELLELTGQAMLDRDVTAMLPHFDLPYRLETIDGHRFVRTAEEFAELFDAMILMRAESGIEDFVRTVIFAEFVDPDTIRSVHLSSEIHAGGELKRPAYPVHSTLVRRGAGWKILTSTYVIHDDADHNSALLQSGRVPSLQN